MVARGVQVAAVARHGVLGRDDEAIAAARKKLAEDGLALTAAVEVRRVDDVAAGVGVQVENAAALPQRRAASLLAEGHRPEEQLGDP